MQVNSNLKPSYQHYRAHRVPSPKLEAVVVYKNKLWKKEYESCDLLDISHGGVGIECKLLVAEVGQKVDLDIYYQTESFHIRGFITHKSVHRQTNRYGIAFIRAPIELDRLIDFFLADYVQKNVSPPVPAEEIPKQHRENRLALKDTQIYARKNGSQNPFVLCQVENISKGGIGFFSQYGIDREAPFDVAIQISDSSNNMLIVGKVCYMSRKPDGYYYGAQYKLVPMEFVRILQTLEEDFNGQNFG